MTKELTKNQGMREKIDWDDESPTVIEARPRPQGTIDAETEPRTPEAGPGILVDPEEDTQEEGFFLAEDDQTEEEPGKQERQRTTHPPMMTGDWNEPWVHQHPKNPKKQETQNPPIPHPPIPSVSNTKKNLKNPRSFWDSFKNTAFLGMALVLSSLGIKTAENTKKAEETDRIASTILYIKNAEANQSISPPEDREQQESHETSSHLAPTYIVKKNDTLWGIANDMLEKSRVKDDGTLALALVQSLREENNIQGNPAKSPKMWVGETLQTKQTSELLRAHMPHQKEHSHDNQETSKKETSNSQVENNATKDQKDLRALKALQESLKNVLLAHDAAPSELLAAHLKHGGETIWTRAHDILESLGVQNPNIAKRSVLTAVILADSRLNEAQAMRIKSIDNEKFDPQKDTLNFSRAEAVAKDLRNGMSPSAVAQKYGVTNVYKHIKNR